MAKTGEDPLAVFLMRHTLTILMIVVALFHPIVTILAIFNPQWWIIMAVFIPISFVLFRLVMFTGDQPRWERFAFSVLISVPFIPSVIAYIILVKDKNLARLSWKEYFSHVFLRKKLYFAAAAPITNTTLDIGNNSFVVSSSKNEHAVNLLKHNKVNDD